MSQRHPITAKFRVIGAVVEWMEEAAPQPARSTIGLTVIDDAIVFSIADEHGQGVMAAVRGASIDRLCEALASKIEEIAPLPAQRADTWQ